MTPLEIIRRAQADTLIDEDGKIVALELLPSLSQTKVSDFARQAPCRIPPEIVELLSASRGFYGTVEQVEFTGRDLIFEFEAAFPFGLPIAADGYGNFWVVDLHPHTAKWGPINFACHDAPVILYQAVPGRLARTVLEQAIPDVRATTSEPRRRRSRGPHSSRVADESRGSFLRGMSPVQRPDPFGLRARTRRQLSDHRSAPGEARRWFFLGPVRL